MTARRAQAAISNYFEESAARGPDGDAQRDDLAWLVRLLGAVAEEWSALAQEITRLGEALSTEALAQGSTRMVRDLQKFDPVGQKAAAQAYLLRQVALQLRTHELCADKSLKTIIGDMPFLEVRERLSAALLGHDAQSVQTSNSDDAVDWF